MTQTRKVPASKQFVGGNSMLVLCALLSLLINVNLAAFLLMFHVSNLSLTG